MALDSFQFRSPLSLDPYTKLDLPAFKPQASLKDRPLLPSIGHDISRPSSASTTASSTMQLPALSTLASVASSSALAQGESVDAALYMGATPAAKVSPLPPSNPPTKSHSMTYATSAPATAGGGPSNQPPVCQNCTTSTTPLWRRDESGSVLCNACGLFLKLHGRPRPISLKTDVIKSRNRVKTGGAARKKPGETTGLPAAHPEAADPSFSFQQRRASGKVSSGLSERSHSPVSRTATPVFTHPANIAPQHMFDAATGVLTADAFHSPSLSASFLPRQPSPGAVSSINGSHLEPPASYDQLSMQNNYLKTRVSELEVINDLFRGRVEELENSEHQLRQELEEVRQREAELKRRLDEYEGDGPAHKRLRLGDVIDEDRTGTPISSLGK